MKRKLSLLLAVIMILGSFSFAFAAEETAEETAGAFLKKVGVLEGINGNLKLEDNLRRQDAVVLVARLHDAEKEAKAYSPEGLTFTDFKDPFYRPIIKWAVDEGLVEGHTAERFGFNEDVTAQQYVTILLRALGYNEEAEDYDKVMDLAKKLGLLEDVKAEAKDEVTRGQMSVLTFNALGTEMKDSKETLADKLGIEMPAPDKPTELTAKVKDTENLKEVVLELSNAELVDKDKLENVNNYKVVDNKIQKIEIDGDDVIITLEEALLQGREYKLRVRSIDKAINKEYTFTAKDNTIPSVEKVEFLQKNGIKLRTSEPINILDNVRGRTFEVDGKNIAMDVEVYGRDVILTPYYNETFSKDIKTITVSGLADFAGFRSAKEEFPIEMIEDTEAPKVVDVIVRTDKKVEVVFDKDIYIGSVDEYYDKNNVGNISYQSGRHTVYATKATKIDTNKVVYEFKEEFLRTRTDFTIVDVENHSGVAMEKTTMVAREILDNVEPEIYKNEVSSKRQADGTMNTTITLYFDKDVYGVRNEDDNGFELKQHFNLYEREIRNYNVQELIDSAEYKKDASDKPILDIVVVELKGLTEWSKTNEKDYVLEVEGFATDNSLRRSRMYRDYVEFKAQQGTGFVIVTDGIKVTGNKYETQINIEFNKPVDRAIAEDFKNYIFTDKDNARKDVKDLKGRIVTERDGYEVTIILPDFDVDKFNNFRILDTLKTRTGQRLDRVYVYDFETGFADNKDYTIKKVDGDFVITPNAEVEEITLKTDVEGKFIVDNTGRDLEKLVINAPKADVVVKGHIDEVVIEAIKGETLTIEGTVNKVTVETDKEFNVKIGVNKDFTVVSKVEKATLNVNGTKVEVKEGKDVKVTVDADGNVTPKLVGDLDLEGAKQKLAEAITKAETLLENENLKDEDVKAALRVARNNAKAIKDAEDAKLAEVEEALTNLNKAIKDVEDAIEAEAEIEAARQAVTDAQTALDNAVQARKDAIDENHEDVADEKTALDEAKAELEKLEESDEGYEAAQEAVADAEAALNQAIIDAKAAINEDHKDVADEKAALDEAKATLDELLGE